MTSSPTHDGPGAAPGPSPSALTPAHGRGLLGPGERWAVVTALSYTTVNVLLRWAAVEIDPWLGSMLRQVPLALLAWTAVLWVDRESVQPSSARFIGWPVLAALVAGGFASFVIGNVFFFGALANGGLGVAAAGAQGGVVVAGALASIALRERPSPQAWVGISIICAGLVFVATAHGAPGDAWLLGLLLALGAGTSYAVSNLVTRTVQRRRAALWVTLAANSVGGFGILLVIQAIRGGGNPLAGTTLDIALIVLAAGCVNALALIGIAQSLRHISVAASSSIQSATVVFSFIAAVLIFDETAALPMVVGVTAVAAGIIVASLRRREAAAATAATPDR